MLNPDPQICTADTEQALLIVLTFEGTENQIGGTYRILLFVLLHPLQLISSAAHSSKRNGLETDMRQGSVLRVSFEKTE